MVSHCGETLRLLDERQSRGIVRYVDGFTSQLGFPKRGLLAHRSVTSLTKVCFGCLEMPRCGRLLLFVLKATTPASVPFEDVSIWIHFW